VRILNQVNEKWSERLAAAVPDVEVTDVPQEGPLPEGLSGDVLFTWGFDNTVDVARQSGVPWVHFAGTGVDCQPIESLAALGCTITCSRGVSGVPIAEFVMAAILAMEKRLPEVWVDEPADRWGAEFRLGELTGKVVGLVGMGGIGTEVARRALAFDMEVVAARASGAASPVEGVRVTALDDVLATADHLVLAVPLTDATAGMIGVEALERVKPGVHLVNVSRGGLVDQEALLAAVDDGRVAMATLDTVTPEPLPDGHPFYAHPRIRVSPHISWSSPHANRRILAFFVDNLERFRDGRTLRGVVGEGGY